MAIPMKRLIPVATLMLSFVAVAQQPGPPPGASPGAFDDPADAAQHGVARISLADGNVTVTRGNSDEPIDSTLNAPLVATDRIATGDGARAEIQFDFANLIRLAPNTEVRMGDLQYHSYLIQIVHGTVMFRTLRDSDARVGLSTPNVTVEPLRQGAYRVTVRADGTSEITVRAGEANITAPNGSERLQVGQTMQARGSASDPEFMTVGAIAFDEWDRFNTDRDHFFERYDNRANDAARYTGADMPGAEDLAANGHWVFDPTYGNVWVPNDVPPDWAPYRDGRWDYLDYYGWSWVSYDPWGWAPYHYGNWYRARFGWAWYPGALGPRRYFRPAMVGFFGFGGGGFGTVGVGLSLGFGYGNVGWVPLAPFEAYHPWYGRGTVLGRGGAIVGNVNIANTYLNARYANAVTGMRAGDFGRTAVSRTAFVRPAAAELTRAGMVNGAVPFAPARSVSAGGVRANAVVPLNGNGQNSGGWRRLDSSTGTRTQAAGQAGGFRAFSQQPSSQQASSRQLQGSPAQGQPVRISPSIVTNRGSYAAGGPGASQAAPRYAAPANAYGGFGGPRPGYSAAPAQRSAAPGYSPAAGRSAPSGGGGSRGGGHGGGHR
jgi:hypothetical protein